MVRKLVLNILKLWFSRFEATSGICVEAMFDLV